MKSSKLAALLVCLATMVGCPADDEDGGAPDNDLGGSDAATDAGADTATDTDDTGADTGGNDTSNDTGPDDTDGRDTIASDTVPEVVQGTLIGRVPDDRLIAWEAGIPGGIPDYPQSIDVTEAPYNAAGDAVTDDTDAILTALDDCPEGTAVFLPAGTYRVTATITMPAHCVLRGAGPGETIIVGDDAGQDIIELGGSLSYGYFYDGWAGTWLALAEDGEAGSDTIEVADTSTFHVGDLVLIDELNDPDFVDPNGTEGLCNYCGRAEGGRVVGQMVQVTAVSETTVTFDPPLYRTFHTALSAEAKAMPEADVVAWSGLEDLTVTQETAGSLYSIYMAGMYTWVSNVEVTNIDWRAIWLAWNLRSEIRDSYFHEAIGEYCRSHAYAVTLSLQSTANLVENNVFNRVCYASVVFGGAIGNVTGYNYSGETVYSASDDWLVAAYGSHGAHPSLNLWEGNVGNKFYDDFIHGSASQEMLFRNRLRGAQSDRVDANIAIGFEQHQTRMTVIGNVLGEADHTEVYEQAAPGPFDTWVPTIWALGLPEDPDVAESLVRWGNYDYFHGCVWDDEAGECLDGAEIEALQLPASLYLDGPPSWWNDSPWPPFGPDAGDPSAPRLGVLPAEDRFYELTGD